MFLLIDKTNFLYNLLKKKKNEVFYLCHQKECQTAVEPSGDNVPYLVICISGLHNNDTDLMKLHAEKLSGKKLHLEKNPQCFSYRAVRANI